MNEHFMELAPIKQLLEKYKDLLFQNEKKYKEICEIIEAVSGIRLSEKNITIRNREIIVLENSVVKNEIYLYKEDIIKELHRKKIETIDNLR